MVRGRESIQLDLHLINGHNWSVLSLISGPGGQANNTPLSRKHSGLCDTAILRQVIAKGHRGFPIRMHLVKCVNGQTLYVFCSLRGSRNNKLSRCSCLRYPLLWASLVLNKVIGSFLSLFYACSPCSLIGLCITYSACFPSYPCLPATPANNHHISSG